MQQFEAYTVALEIIRELRPLIGRISKQDRDLAKQVKRAGSSLALNLREGNRRRGGDRTHQFSIAAGSADEVVAALDVSEAWGYLSSSSVEQVRELLDRELAMLWRLTHPRP